ncbi:esterase/lipase family protein [Deinococcus lacus]|uniref:triacylglycerol lipase n=1 Tax=Deinococcus lacus TaxID=392561 RepID=A0ABW1Y971_9DEIO
MKKWTVILSLSLLTACGNQAVPGAAPQTTNYAEQKAAFAAQQPEAPAPGASLESGVRVERADGQLTTMSNSLPGSISAQSIDKSVPIVLVHGLGGWGEGEFLGMKYWGGFRDVVADLRSQGYTVYNVSVGPVSSNWDRAAEVYTQIKGGCVDYGQAHSSAAGHARTDATKCHPGFYPQWDSEHPVNLIGHSMGAPTARMLVALLEKGSPENADGDNLFVGGRTGWVKGVMTISGTNTGSPAADQLQSAIPFLKDLILGVAALAGTPDKNTFYDLDMGQWGLRRRADESFQAYLDRVFSPTSPLWKSNDQAAFDLSPEGADAVNRWMGRSEHTRYFSWATADTYTGLISGWQYPRPTMNPLMQVASYPYPWPLPNGLGNLKGRSPNRLFTYGPDWWQNDGLVPVKVQHAPWAKPA